MYLIVPLMGFTNEKVSLGQVNAGGVPKCSTGEKVELDVELLKKSYPEEYANMPFVVRVLGFRPMMCRD